MTRRIESFTSEHALEVNLLTADVEYVTRNRMKVIALASCGSSVGSCAWKNIHGIKIIIFECYFLWFRKLLGIGWLYDLIKWKMYSFSSDQGTASFKLQIYIISNGS